MTTPSTPKVSLNIPSAVKDKPAAEPSKVRVFHGEFGTYQNYLTPKGKIIKFYQGFCKTSDKEVIEYCSELEHVTDVTDSVDIDKVPEAPLRKRNGGWQSNNAEATVISPTELLQRAVANSAQVPHAVQS